MTFQYYRATNTHHLKRGFHALLFAICISFFTGCAVFTDPSSHSQRASQQTPLDPIIGDTGQPLSDIALKADVQSYEINIEVFPANQSIKGNTVTTFLIVEPTSQLELKLDSRFRITRVEVNGDAATHSFQKGTIVINLPEASVSGTTIEANVYYEGQPHVALRAPWDGGFVWGKTTDDIDWIATAVQGEGCDLFWPCKDHFIDKANSTAINLTVPTGLVAVTNGVLQNTVEVDQNRTRFEWLLSVPASDYNIALNIGPFVHIRKDYKSVNGKFVPIEFWALKENKDKAETLIDDDLVHQLAFFEEHLGAYPWGNEKLGFVETPHLGMEHQTINAYGRAYKRDKHGFDWLLHHELAHEWFGNLMTHKRINDAWLHEGFGLYMQPAYSLYKYGEAAYMHRMYESFLRLKNCSPIVRSDVISSDEAFNSDIYGKGGWALHTLRWLIGEDLFWATSRELVYGQANGTKNLQPPISTRYRSTQDYIDIVNEQTGTDYTWFFDVYLKQAELPKLISERRNKLLTLTWETPGDLPFDMPIPLLIDDELTTVNFVNNIAQIKLSDNSHVVIDPSMRVLRKLPIIATCDEREQEKTTNQ